MKLEVTIDDYKKVAPKFFEKYWFVAEELGEGAKVEEILKVMETIANVAMREKVTEKIGPFGFNKKTEDSKDEV